MDSTKLFDMNRRFNERLNELASLKGQNTQFFTSTSYAEMIQKVKIAKNKISNKKPEDYQRLRRFDVMNIGDTEKLIVPVKEIGLIKFYVHNEEIFQILLDTHIATSHGGRNRMEKELNARFKNITREMVVIFLNLCENCEKKHNVPKKSSLVKPTSSNELNARCQVDVIDMPLKGEDDKYKFILVYQDHVTKFVQLRPLQSKTAKEVAHELIDIFTIFGAPCVLESGNGREFATEIVQELCELWPELKIVHGKLNQGLERKQQDIEIIENMLSSWMEDNNTKKWSEGLRFVQLMKNGAHHADVNCSPYEAMFGTKMKVGLKSSSIPPETLKGIHSEEDLEKYLSNENKTTKYDIEVTVDGDTKADSSESLRLVSFPAVFEEDEVIDENIISPPEIKRERKNDWNTLTEK